VEKNVDVLIIGSGMAGACLARQLKLEFPQLKICVLEKKQVFVYWVGESITEVFEDYAIRTLKLNRYLHSQHISKYGFRFWWDKEDKSLPIEQMSANLDFESERLE